MSIIYDALKKAGKLTGPDVVPKAHERPLPVWQLFLAGLLCLALLISADRMVRRWVAGSEARPSAVVPETPQPPGAVRSATPESRPPVYKIGLFNAKSFELNGVFFTDGRGYAVINNRVLKEGDIIDGVRVEKITLAAVSLRHHNRLITIPTGTDTDQ